MNYSKYKMMSFFLIRSNYMLTKDKSPDEASQLALERMEFLEGGLKFSKIHRIYQEALKKREEGKC